MATTVGMSSLNVKPFMKCTSRGGVASARALRRVGPSIAKGTLRAQASAQGTTEGTSPRIEFDEWDIIQYKSMGDQPGRRLGRVAEKLDEEVLVEPLVEKERGIWVIDEDLEDPVSISSFAVELVVPAEYGQRAIEDRISNPHGEHAEEIWEVLGQVGADVFRGSYRPH